MPAISILRRVAGSSNFAQPATSSIPIVHNALDRLRRFWLSKPPGPWRVKAKFLTPAAISANRSGDR
jgi:hypothetical protein